MDERERQAFADWVQAELDERADAEERFRSLFARHVPSCEPAKDFAARTLRGLVRRAPAGTPVLVWGWAALAPVLILAGSAVFLADPVAAINMLLRLGLTGGEAAAWLVAALEGWLQAAGAAWACGSALGHAALSLVTSGGVPWFLAANVVVAGLSCLALARLLPSDSQEEYL